MAVTLEDAGAAPGPLLGRVLAAAAAGARVLVIRNTVGGAMAVQQALEEAAGPDSPLLFRHQGVPAPHHSRFAAEDRKGLDLALEARFGPAAPVAGGVVAVTTQTAEQSLDLDADLMVSDLCPIDVLLQRLGRLHRHPARDPDRPAAHAAPALWLIAPDEATLGTWINRQGEVTGKTLLGLGWVYSDLIALLATRRLAAERTPWRLPAINRDLVEQATHPEALRALAETLGGPWKSHWQHGAASDGAVRNLASINSLKWTKPLPPLPPSATLDGVIATRLGLDTRLVELPGQVPGPFGLPIQTLPLPGRMAPGAAPDAVATLTSAPTGTVRFQFAGRPFLYDRLGLRPDGTGSASV